MTVPKDHNMEETFLSALLHNPDEIPKATAVDQDVDLMHQDENREIWRSILELYKDESPIDPTTVRSHIVQKGYLNENTAKSRLRKILLLKETAGNVEGWTEKLSDLKARRKIITSCADAKQMAKDMNTSLQDIRRKLTDRMAESQNIDHPHPLGDVSLSLIERLDEEDFDGLSGKINTGIQELDDILNGLMWDDFVGILSRPGWGKTSLMIQIILGMKVLYPEGVIDVFTMEMSEQRITYRFVSQISGVPYKMVSNLLEDGADVGNDVESKVRKALHTFHEWEDDGSIRLYTGSKTPEEVTQLMLANAMKNEDGKYMGGFVDNFQTLDDVPTLQEKEAAIRSLKNVTIDADVPVFLLIQLNRKPGDVPPEIKHAKGVGQIEQDLDRGIIIDRPDERGKFMTEAQLEEKGIKIGEAIIDVDKNREAGPDRFTKMFHGPTMQFLDEKPFGDEGPPAAGRDPIGLSDSDGVEEASEEDVEELFSD